MSELNLIPWTSDEGRAAMSNSLREFWVECKFSSWAAMVPSNSVNRYRPPPPRFRNPTEISQHACRQINQRTAPRQSKTSSKDTVPFPSRTELLVSAQKGRDCRSLSLSSLRFSEAFRVYRLTHIDHPPLQSISVGRDILLFLVKALMGFSGHSTRLLRRTGPA